MTMSEMCVCGSGKTYFNCCGRFIEKEEIATTPEELMRSRYTAYTKANIEYIVKTMQGVAAQGFDKEQARHWAEQAKWLKLKVLNTRRDQDKGFVEFIATYLLNNKQQSIHEISEFQYINNHWYYVDGKHVEDSPSYFSQKIGRNDPCPCGSQKKYKKCCG